MDVMDDVDKARALHRLGLRRLFMLALREQTKFLEKNLAGLRDMALVYAALDFGKGEGTPLREQLIAAAFERACMADPLPATKAQFELRCTEAKSRLNLIANELCRLVGGILGEYQALQKKLQGAKAFAQVVQDVQEQFSRLIVKDFIAATPFERLQHFPRYLKAAALRIDKLRTSGENGAVRDARLMADFMPLCQQWQREDLKHKKARAAHPQLEQFRWLLEELRVQLHAQELRTPAPVSVKRLQKMWEAMER
jgi:ATP-dependent helicase HrpA